jgi:hypothetical protein
MDFYYFLKKAREVDLIIDITFNDKQKKTLELIKLSKYSKIEEDLYLNKMPYLTIRSDVIQYFKEYKNQNTVNKIDDHLFNLLDGEMKNEIFIN